jgi:hypothetical protein
MEDTWGDEKGIQNFGRIIGIEVKTLGVNRRIILKYILRKQTVRVWTELKTSVDLLGTVASSQEHGNGPSVCAFFYQMNNSWLLKEEYVP